ncbi:dienelactone hydrolase family protein [Glaciihabitans sp. dw_435]|uniref:dienelactone hydrolase family protein n=1 Tax=Glaciihabitans sp. dw_435 TaxID=2720081 RepID=UPI00210417B2|nr:dienelactone hydrolase family protein [Glaciihabitans sp. dw_435]
MIDIDAGTLTAYRADPPAGTEIKGGLIVIHEIWGLVANITDIADRFAVEGYVVIAPDILSHAGVTPAVGAELQAIVFHPDEKVRTDAQPVLREKLAAAHDPAYGAWAVESLTKYVDYLAAQPGVDGRIAVTGFCFGGSYAFALASADDRVLASVPFYGYPPADTEIASIGCPVLAFYGDEDTRLMESLPELTATMDAAGVDFTPKVYAGVGHAFFNDTNSITYREDAAQDAWGMTLWFLQENLAGRSLSR